MLTARSLFDRRTSATCSPRASSGCEAQWRASSRARVSALTDHSRYSFGPAVLGYAYNGADQNKLARSVNEPSQSQNQGFQGLVVVLLFACDGHHGEEAEEKVEHEWRSLALDRCQDGVSAGAWSDATISRNQLGPLRSNSLIQGFIDSMCTVFDSSCRCVNCSPPNALVIKRANPSLTALLLPPSLVHPSIFLPFAPRLSDIITSA